MRFVRISFRVISFPCPSRSSTETPEGNHRSRRRQVPLLPLLAPLADADDGPRRQLRGGSIYKSRITLALSRESRESWRSHARLLCVWPNSKSQREPDRPCTCLFTLIRSGVCCESLRLECGYIACVCCKINICKGWSTIAVVGCKPYVVRN